MALKEELQRLHKEVENLRRDFIEHNLLHTSLAIMRNESFIETVKDRKVLRSRLQLLKEQLK